MKTENGTKALPIDRPEIQPRNTLNPDSPEESKGEKTGNLYDKKNTLFGKLQRISSYC